MKNFKEKILKIGKKLLSILKFIFKVILFIVDKTYLAIFITILFIGFAWWTSQNPSLYRDWQKSESILPEITFNSGTIDIKNIRNFKYITDTESIPNYYNDTYDLEKLETLYYIIEPFSDYDGPAHTMLSFGFRDGKYVTISAEIRKEKGESFKAIMGLMNQYELVYIVGDENDLVKLRANYRKDVVRMYPIKTDKEKIVQLFQTALHRADKLTKEPEFYNTLWNTCTTSILKHVNALRTEKISGFDIKILLPSNSDKIAYDLGLIDTNLSQVEARKYYEINELSEQFGESEEYSSKIRKERK